MSEPLIVSVDETGQTSVGVATARSIAQRVAEGESLPEAARAEGVVKTDLDRLKSEVARQLKWVLETFNWKDAMAQQVARARLNELMLSPDPQTALGAVREVKKLHGMDKAPVAHLILERPPEAERALSLVEDE